MATYTKEFLSASTNGIGIPVWSESGGTAGTAGTIHQAVSGTGAKDEVYLYATNYHTADVVLTIEWGTSAVPRVVTIPFKAGLVPIIPGLPINNSVKVQAFCATSGMIVIDGYANRRTD
jgi:hypothetical protein